MRNNNANRKQEIRSKVIQISLICILALMFIYAIYNGIFRDKDNLDNFVVESKTGVEEIEEYENIFVYGDDSDFEKLIKSNDTVLVEFKTSWCSYCKELEERLPGIVDKNDKLNIIKVDIEDYSEFAKEYKIMATPTLHLYKDGKFIDIVTGSMSDNYLEYWIETGNFPQLK